MTGFRATGKGFENSGPNQPATESNASAVLVDLSTGAKLYLFVTNVSTSWTLNGSASQTQARRTFYPQYLVQNPLILKGQCPNQYEYDRIVEFVERHHRNVLGLRETGGSVFGQNIKSGGFKNTGPASNSPAKGLEFMLLPETVADRWIDSPSGYDENHFGDPKTNIDHPETRHSGIPGTTRKGIYTIPAVHLAGVVTEIRAGHERFANAPEFEISLKITHDYRQSEYSDVRDIKKRLGWYTSALGNAYKPEEIRGEADTGGGGDFISDLADVANGIGNFVESVTDTLEGYWDTITGGDSK